MRSFEQIASGSAQYWWKRSLAIPATKFWRGMAELETLGSSGFWQIFLLRVFPLLEIEKLRIALTVLPKGSFSRWSSRGTLKQRKDNVLPILKNWIGSGANFGIWAHFFGGKSVRWTWSGCAGEGHSLTGIAVLHDAEYESGISIRCWN